jgi:uncharacterized protein (TIGR03435 family)
MLRSAALLAACLAALWHLARADAQQASTPVTFEVASVKRNTSPPVLDQPRISKAGVRLLQYTLSELVMRAFNVKFYQIIGPSWLNADYYDVIAKAPDGTNVQQIPLMLQNLLVDRFQLRFHRETREFPAYVLLVAKDGAKLIPFEMTDDPLAAERVRVSSSGHIEVKTLKNLANALRTCLERPVFDLTGLQGAFDIKLDLARDECRGLARTLPRPLGAESIGGAASSQPLEAADPGTSSLGSSLKMLGLSLEARKMPIDCIVIDAAEKMPKEN